MAENISGAGLFDALKNPFGTIKRAFTSTKDYGHEASKMLKIYGDERVESIIILKIPLHTAISTTLYVATGGKTEGQTFYHLYMLVNRHIIIEKNEQINIEEFSKVKHHVHSDALKLQVPRNRIPHMTIRQMLDNTQKMMGTEKFFDYRFDTNNCQVFINSILKANNMNSPELEKFIMQDTKIVADNLPSVVKSAVHATTRLGAIVNKLTGSGNKKKALDAFEEHLKGYGREVKDEELNDEFVKFMTNQGLKFL